MLRRRETHLDRVAENDMTGSERDFRVYESAKWYRGTRSFPQDLPDSAAGIHVGMLIRWCHERGLLSDEIASFDGVFGGSRPPSGVAAAVGDLLANDMATEQGRAFLDWYFQRDEDVSLFLDDYLSVLADDVPEAFHVPDVWEGQWPAVVKVLDARWREYSREP